MDTISNNIDSYTYETDDIDTFYGDEYEYDEDFIDFEEQAQMNYENGEYQHNFTKIEGQIQHSDYEGICLDGHDRNTSLKIRRKCAKCRQIYYGLYVIYYNEGRYMRMNDVNMKVLRAIDRKSKQVCNYGLAVIDDIKFEEQMMKIINEVIERNNYEEFMGTPTLNYKYEYEGHLFRFTHDNNPIPDDLIKFSKRNIKYKIYKIYIKRYSYGKKMIIQIKGRISLI